MDCNNINMNTESIPTSTPITELNSDSAISNTIQSTVTVTPRTHLEITDKPLESININQYVLDPTAGAISTFYGITRNHFNGLTVKYLYYECYESMALYQLELLANRIRLNYQEILHLAIIHRIGLVQISESSVIIAVSSIHREAAIKACEYAINELKRTIPIWKQEYYTDGSIWKQNPEWNSNQLTNTNTTTDNSIQQQSIHQHQHCLSCRPINNTNNTTDVNNNTDSNSL